jgi:translation initiation factor 2 subunit 1
LSINGTNGVEVIQKALLAAEAMSSVEEEIEVTCHYNGAPQYRIELKAPDFKTAESIWENATKATLDHVLAAGGEATSYRQ